MSKERLVFETTESRKSELSKLLSIQGRTLKDWFEEQLSTTLHIAPATAIEPPLRPVLHPRDITNEQSVFEDLQSRDWAFTNDDTGYLTHDIHPYPAKFIPQIPAALISRLSLPGDIVLDPFGGSGTTAVEAIRLERRAISVDANPLAALIGRVKTASLLPHVRLQIERLMVAIDTYVKSTKTKKSLNGRKWVPEIPNLGKWFEDIALDELSIIRHLIDELTGDVARDIANLALSRITIRVSNQDSETRYVATSKKKVAPHFVLMSYLESLRMIIGRVETAAQEMQFSDAKFITGDSRYDITNDVSKNSVGFIVTSPPYSNATDYHLYHRFRLFWLGFDPRNLGKIEIGSHLKHQRNQSGFDDYLSDMEAVLQQCFHVLSPGRYAVFVVGDAVFNGKSFDTSHALAERAISVGFTVCGEIDRPIHETKRSFAKPARRARTETLLVLRKPDKPVAISVLPPLYTMWPYEYTLQKMELSALTRQKNIEATKNGLFQISLNQEGRWAVERMTFSKGMILPGGYQKNTWQKVLENGDNDTGKRKESKYATHGIHPYKGKFYPQLARSLINISGTEPGMIVLDPFCGSGTVILEGYLNGFRSYGCDMHPLAAKISSAKVGILTVPRAVSELAIDSLLHSLESQIGIFQKNIDQFAPTVHEELLRWFPEPVIFKMNWLLSQIRLFGEPKIVDFLEIVLSSCIRDISQQDPNDLRIRRRKKELKDAPVIELFTYRLHQQFGRLRHYWSVASKKLSVSYVPIIIEGDSSDKSTIVRFGLANNSVDLVVTSPPYATALPYIDTDRLSLMALMGMPSSRRSVLEESLTGSREIKERQRVVLEETLMSKSALEVLPNEIVQALRYIYKTNVRQNAGFRRLNMPSLLWRYFINMKKGLEVVHAVMKSRAKAYYVVGDSKTKVGDRWFAIHTTNWISLLAEQVGFTSRKFLDISVTTENMKHQKNAITENVILEFTKK